MPGAKFKKSVLRALNTFNQFTLSLRMLEKAYRILKLPFSLILRILSVTSNVTQLPNK